MVEVLLTSLSLQHVDFSNMGLRERVVPLVEAMTKSSSIISMHIGGNNLSTKAIEQICFELKLDYRNYVEKLQDSVKPNESDDLIKA